MTDQLRDEQRGSFVNVPGRGGVSRPLPRLGRIPSAPPSLPVAQKIIMPSSAPESVPTPSPLQVHAISQPLAPTPPAAVSERPPTTRHPGKAIGDINFSIIPDAIPDAPLPLLHELVGSDEPVPVVTPTITPDDVAALELHPSPDHAKLLKPRKIRKKLGTVLRKPSKKSKRVHETRHRGNRNWKLKPTHIMSVSLVGLFITGGMVISQVTTPKTQQAAANTQAVLSAHQTLATATDQKVSMEKPTSETIATYKTSSSLPRVLTIDSIGLTARVGRVAENTTGQLKAPDNLYDAAWYHDSARTGAAGVSMLVGAENDGGVFSRLSEVKVNDTITIERGDSVPFKFQVRKVERGISNETTDALLETPDATVPWVVLVSCTSENNMVCGTSNRTIVFARQI